MMTSGPDQEPGINGGISQSPTPNGQPVVNTIAVEDIDAIIERATAAGAQVLEEKMPIPGGDGWVAYLTDPNGIVIGVYASDESAGQ